MAEKVEGMLSPYRVLDLADETGVLCGKILGDLGADVIKIEKPGGDATRRLGPFYHDKPDPEKSLFWFAFNNNKRGITLDIETADGQEIFKRLVKTAYLVIETFPAGHLDRLGLGYSDLEKLNGGIILVSITPFGQTGPYKDYKPSDIIFIALSGQMYTWGDADRAPIRISHHSQAYLHTGADAAVGGLMALIHREMTGVGQQINISVRWASLRAAGAGPMATWDRAKRNEQRGGLMRDNPNIRRRQILPCKDGYVNFRWMTGQNAKRFQQPFIDWMTREGMAGELEQIDLDTLDFMNTTQDVVDRLEEISIKFLMTHTKAELHAQALKHNIQLYPVNTTKDILENEQLGAREFWVELEHPELGTSITYPGAFVKTTEAPIKIRRRAPLIGEHNQEIYERELGIPGEELAILKQARVI